MKRVFLLLIALLLVIGLFGCTEGSIANWENEDALYVYTSFEDSSAISEKIEKAFENYKYKKVFLVNKSLEKNGSAKLLFIFDSVADKEAFHNQVKNDNSVAYADNCGDIPYESVDTRHIVCDKNVIKVGETATLEIKGISDYYIQPFDFNGFIVLPKESAQSKEYSVSDFPQINLQKIEKIDNGWLYFRLNSNDYFSLIKSIDVISRLDNIEKIDFDQREITLIPPPIWEVSDSSIVEIVEKDDNSEKIVVKGLAKGEVLISFEGVTSTYKLTVE